MKTKPCRWWHKWTPIEDSEWLGNIAFPVFRLTCLRCGATKIWRAGL